MKKNIRLKWIMLLLQMILSVAMLFVILKLNVLPTKYVLLVGLILLVFLLIIFVLMNVSGKKKKYRAREIIAIVLSVLLSLSMIVGVAYIVKTSSFFDGLSNANTQIRAYAVYVKKDSKIEKVEDLKNSKIGLNKKSDASNVQKVITELKKEVSGISCVQVNDYIKLANFLYDDSIDGMLINEAFIPFIQEEYPKFLEETKIVWEYKIEEKLNNLAKDVDVTKDPFVIYLSGIDTRGPVSTVSRSDVNMIVTVNPLTHKILLTSIPRDYYVTLPNYGAKDKLTHAGLDGVEHSVKTLENLLDININYSAKVNFTTIEQIVNALGGVNVYSPYTFVTVTGLHIVEGTNYLDGEGALAFVRERYALPNGDNDRVHNQQLLVRAMIEKAISPAIIYNYMDILSAIEGCFETNMSQSDITSLIKKQLNDAKGWDITQTQLTGSGTTMYGGAMMPDYNLYYMIPNEQSVLENSNMIKSVLAER